MKNRSMKLVRRSFVSEAVLADPLRPRAGAARHEVRPC